MPNWSKLYLEPRMLVIILLGFSCGIPLFLTTSTLGVWLAEEGISLTSIGLFAFVSLPYAIKFLWSPFMDHLKIPYFNRVLGFRRSWILVSQIGLIFCCLLMSQLNPHEHLKWMAVNAFLLTIFAATQDTAMLAYQLERFPKRKYGPGEAMGVTGYRLGMLFSGAGALYISHFFSWEVVYSVMSCGLLVGVITVLNIKEPDSIVVRDIAYVDLGQRIKQSVLLPLRDYTKHKAWLVSLILMMTYKIDLNLLGSMLTTFYLEAGFSKVEIASAAKLFGMWMTIMGGLVGGVLSVRLGFLKSVMFCFIIHAIANIMLVVMAYVGYDINMLYISSALEHFTSGMRTSAFCAYQLSLCNPAFAATHVAILTSVASSGRIVFTPLSGWLAEILGWVDFFWMVVGAAVIPISLCAYMMHVNNQLTWFKKPSPAA